MPADPISSILSLVDARAACVGGFTIGGDWAIAFPPPNKIKFFALARGSCWLKRDGEPSVRLAAGDVLMLAAPKGFVLASDLALPPQPAAAVFAGADGKGLLSLGTGAEVYLLGGHVDVDRTCGRLLFDILPARIHLDAGCPEAAKLHWLIDQLVREYTGDEVGTEFARAGFAQLMFLLMLRGYLAHNDGFETGLLRAIGDPRLAPALKLMHGEPERAWRLSELAHAAAMSRTAFALRFKAVAGVAPLAYLTEWRMRLAERRLKEGEMSVYAIARSLGYASEAAFSNAFKRVTGAAPRGFRRAVHAALREPESAVAEGF